MSIEDLYAYIQGESQAVEKMIQYPSGAGLVYIMDENRVRMAGDNIVIWDAVTGGVQLVEDTDYTLGHVDAELSSLEGRTIYGGYQIINVAYQGVNLYIDADIIGGYTTRPYRPTYTNITADYTTAPSSVDDSIFADSESNPIAVTLADGTYVNQRFAVACTGVNNVTVSGTGLEATAYNNIAVQFIWNGTGWLQLGGAGGGDSAGNLSVGMVAWFPGSGQIPHDKLDANGALVNILDYQGLYGKYGILYGGDGITTFGLPNLQGIFPGSYGVQGTHGNAGWNIGDLVEDSFESHTHIQNSHTHTITGTSSAGGSSNAVMMNGDNLGNKSWTSNSRTAVNQSTGGTETRPASIIGRWLIQAFDTVQEVPGDPSLIPAWVEEYSNPTPQTTIVEYVDNDWGGGLFYFGVSYIFLTDEVRTNGIMAVEIDGIDRTATLNANGSSSVIVKYYGATNEFRAFAIGTDFTSVSMVAIYKWDNVASGTLNPPVDGWETVFEDWSNLGDVTNQWGTGYYKFILSNATTPETATSLVSLVQVGAGAFAFRGSSAPIDSSGNAVQVTRLSTSNTFSVSDVGTVTAPRNIKQILKFNSLVNVVHTNGNGIIQDEDVGGQWVTRWAGGRMEITKYEAVNPQTDITYSTPFIASPNMLLTPVSAGVIFAVIATGTASSFLAKIYSSTFVETADPFMWQATGRWK